MLVNQRAQQRTQQLTVREDERLPVACSRWPGSQARRPHCAIRTRPATVLCRERVEARPQARNRQSYAGARAPARVRPAAVRIVEALVQHGPADVRHDDTLGLWRAGAQLGAGRTEKARVARGDVLFEKRSRIEWSTGLRDCRGCELGRMYDTRGLRLRLRTRETVRRVRRLNRRATSA